MSIDAIWHGDGTRSRVARALLTPLSLIFGALVRVRSAVWDLGIRRAASVGVPVLSIGNLTVGGTGKTPIASWFAGALRARGARPAIVLRGYGGDEPLVHGTLEADVPVVADPDRVRGVRKAIGDGANVVILDDAFQHRRLARDHDIVLLSADRGSARARLLPAGPFREPWAALHRATMVIVTRRAASDEAVDALCREAAARLRGGTTHVAVVRLEALDLRDVATKARDALSALDGARVLAVSAIGDPGAFAAQLRAAGASVEHEVHPDHHRFGAADVARIAARGATVDRIVCTLKDAVKLGPLWPRAAPPIWYLSQRVVVERGESAVHAVLDAVIAAARGPHSPTPATGDRRHPFAS